MERVRVLIQKLQEQQAAGADAAQLLPTVRQLAAELEILLPRPVRSEGGRVAVIWPSMPVALPGSSAPDAGEPSLEQTPLPAESTPAPVAIQPVPSQTEPLAQPVAPAVPEPVAPAEPEGPYETQPRPAMPYSLRPPGVIASAAALPADAVPPVSEAPAAPALPEAAPEPTPAPLAPAPEPSKPVAPAQAQLFNALEDVPTLAQQQTQPPREVYELLGGTPEASLNDKLKTPARELAHKLIDTPIKDLRKGIGINDRYLFISELFRGDETMYERSIKTINNFAILPEAEYWINRELTVKLGWDDHTDTVQHFYHLVRRRFS